MVRMGYEPPSSFGFQSQHRTNSFMTIPREVTPPLVCAQIHASGAENAIRKMTLGKRSKNPAQSQPPPARRDSPSGAAPTHTESNNRGRLRQHGSNRHRVPPRSPR